MSLISNHGANVSVTVILNESVRDGRGAVTTNEIGRVVSRGRLNPSTSSDMERVANTGIAASELQRFITAEFPGDDLSQVLLSDGSVWDVVGVVQRYRSSRRTSRDIVLLTATSQKGRRRWDHGTGV